MPSDWELSQDEQKNMNPLKPEDKANVKEEKEPNTDTKTDVKTELTSPAENVTENKNESKLGSEFAEYGIIFKVQLASTEKKINIKKQFKDIDDIQEINIETGYRYYAGKFKTMEEARKYQESLKEKGLKDTFVVAFQNGKRITASEAVEILKSREK